MIRHWLRLIWNRKRANFLIMVEIFISFLVLEGVMIVVSQYAYNYRHPLGYSIDNVWSVNVDMKEQNETDATRLRQRATYTQLLLMLRDVPEIEASAAAGTGPYINSTWSQGFESNGRHLEYGANQVTDGFAQVFGLHLMRGRWFSREDDAASDRPIVITARMAREVFGETDPIGRIIPRDPEKPSPGEPAQDPPRRVRVIGVIDDFRQHGEFSTIENYVFYRHDLEEPKTGMPNRLLIKVRPGTTVAFEEALTRRLQGIARDWSFEIKPLSAYREENLRQYLQPAIALGVVSVFLLLMVALGLTGVVWQNVTQRVREIGLRRAKGARIEDIHRQILGELAVMTSLALVIAVVIIVQAPLLPLPAAFHVISGAAFAASIVMSVLTIYVLTIGCGWYPARLATRIQPAEALHYE